MRFNKFIPFSAESPDVGGDSAAYGILNKHAKLAPLPPKGENASFSRSIIWLISPAGGGKGVVLLVLVTDNHLNNILI